MNKFISIVCNILIIICFNNSIGAANAEYYPAYLNTSDKETVNPGPSLSQIEALEKNSELMESYLRPSSLRIQKLDEEDKAAARAVYKSGYDRNLLTYARIEKFKDVKSHPTLQKILEAQLLPYRKLKEDLLRGGLEARTQELEKTFCEQLMKNTCQQAYGFKYLRLPDRFDRKLYMQESYRQLNTFFLKLSSLSAHLVFYIKHLEGPDYLVKNYGIAEEDLQKLEDIQLGSPHYAGVDKFFASYRDVFFPGFATENAKSSSSVTSCNS